MEGLTIAHQSACHRGGTSCGGQWAPERGRDEQAADVVISHDRPTVESSRDREIGLSEQRFRPK